MTELIEVFGSAVAAMIIYLMVSIVNKQFKKIASENESLSKKLQEALVELEEVKRELVAARGECDEVTATLDLVIEVKNQAIAEEKLSIRIMTIVTFVLTIIMAGFIVF